MYEDNENQTGNVEKSLNIKTTRSEVWNHFVVEIRTNSTYKTICKYCGNSFVCKKIQEQSTWIVISNFLAKQILIKIWNICFLENLLDLNMCFYFRSISRKCLAKLIVYEKLPFKTMEYPLFINFVNNLQPLFSIVDHHTIKNNCIVLYKKEKEKLQENLKNIIVVQVLL